MWKCRERSDNLRVTF